LNDYTLPLFILRENLKKKKGARLLFTCQSSKIYSFQEKRRQAKPRKTPVIRKIMNIENRGELGSNLNIRKENRPV
jgi:hypothetical protein